MVFAVEIKNISMGLTRILETDLVNYGHHYSPPLYQLNYQVNESSLLEG